jgi:hypothetical protein
VTATSSVHAGRGASRPGQGAATAPPLSELVCLAATPTFAFMALLSGLSGTPWTVSARQALGRH